MTQAGSGITGNPNWEKLAKPPLTEGRRPDQGYSMWPRWVVESPGGSVVGSIMPRMT